jgi:hypothetical protein
LGISNFLFGGILLSGPGFFVLIILCRNFGV